MNNEVQHFKIKIENIPIPEEKLNFAIHRAIKNGEKTRGSRINKKIYGLAIVASLFIFFIGASFVSPAFAKMLQHIPVLGSILSTQDSGLHEASKKGLIKSIGETVVDHDIPITITDVYYDKFRLVIGYKIPIKPELLKDNEIFEGYPEVQLLVDGQNIMSYGNKITIEDGYLIGAIQSERNLPDTFNLNISFHEVLNKTGKWDFEFPVSIEEFSREYEVNQRAEHDNKELLVETISSTPSGTMIKLSIESNERLEDTYTFHLYEQDGTMLELIEENIQQHYLTRFNLDYLKVESLFGPIKKEQVVTIVPVKVDSDYSEKELEELAIEIDLTKLTSEPISNQEYKFFDYKPSEETYVRERMVNEVVKYLDLELGEYTKTDLSITGVRFAAEFLQNNNIDSREDIAPVALLREETGLIIYKNDNGMDIVTSIQKVNGKWKTTETTTLQGMSKEKISREYKKKYN
ncbi:DUF4179 domain-containing protein [Bacillus suaedaesalsae]|uniref:DUF4179 domain-containing protein n=1 Tax=Bacillus suaedaesalsae TaxID=2810349 RepID=A0ABS2DG01_9BACI|nr:DUF4179 domain-containing protein [Bacillus suaedaesalsae]MBM6617402.1 DUF4179 domain-containing protein [Bacillus suaedaesalsae]